MSQKDSVSAVLDHLVTAVDNVTGKLGTLETRLVALESEARTGNNSRECLTGSELDKPLFQNMGGARPKHRRMQQLGGDVEILDSDSGGKASKRKKKLDKKASNAIKVMSKEYMRRNTKALDVMVVERKPRLQKL